METNQKAPWPVIGQSPSGFATDPHFMSRSARGLPEKETTDEKVVAFQSKGHAVIDLGLPGSRRHSKARRVG